MSDEHDAKGRELFGPQWVSKPKRGAELSLRDYIATAAMQVLIVRGETTGTSFDLIAQTSYEYADVMLDAREGRL